jgi:putative endonuclease
MSVLAFQDDSCPSLSHLEWLRQNLVCREVTVPGCWLYILRCSDGSYYVGISRAEDLDTRVSQHNQGTFGGYTAKRRPVTLAYSAHFDRIEEAIASERQIKGWAREKKEALIRGDFEALPGLSKRGRRSEPKRV